MPGKPVPIAERIWLHINRTSDGCWEWTGFRNPQGYGMVGTTSGRASGAHRVMYCLHNKIDMASIAGLDVCHHCDNPPCCNPDHLFLGTRKENIADMMRKGRWWGPVGERSRFAKLTAAQVDEIRRLRAAGRTFASLAKQFGVTKSATHKACTGYSWNRKP